MRARIPLAAAMTLASVSAFAAQGSSVAVPFGNLLAQLLSILEPLVLTLAGAMLAWLIARLGPELAKGLHAAHVDQAIAQAIDAGFALAEGAEKGKVLEVPIANKVIRNAAQYLVDQVPDVFKELGESLGPMLVARLSARGALPAQASAANLNLDPYVASTKEGAAS